MSFPTDRKYSDTHEWFLVQGDIVTVGISQFAADELTDITYVDMPAVGTHIDTGGVLGEVESVKATSELVSAIAGEVVAVNQELEEHPEYVNESPFEKAWIVKLKIESAANLEGLMDAKAYEESLTH